jgi:choline dehydrogenase-like flavoprotein
VVGKGFTTHPSSFTYARYPKNVTIKGWDGMCCSSEVHHFSNLMSHEKYYEPKRHGFILESANSLPWGVANLLPGTGAEHLSRMIDYNHIAGCEVIMKSDAYGAITEDEVKFDISEADNERLLYATWLMARMAFRCGAVEVYTGLPGLILTSPSQLDDIYKYKRGKKPGFMLKQANLYSGHIFGGLCMGTDPRASFAGETGECHAVKGLWVGSGSAFPTNTGVNCLMSIQMAARKIAHDFIVKNKGEPQ